MKRNQELASLLRDKARNLPGSYRYRFRYEEGAVEVAAAAGELHVVRA